MKRFFSVALSLSLSNFVFSPSNAAFLETMDCDESPQQRPKRSHNHLEAHLAVKFDEKIDSLPPSKKRRQDVKIENEDQNKGTNTPQFFSSNQFQELATQFKLWNVRRGRPKSQEQQGESYDSILSTIYVSPSDRSSFNKKWLSFLSLVKDQPKELKALFSEMISKWKVLSSHYYLTGLKKAFLCESEGHYSILCNLAFKQYDSNDVELTLRNAFEFHFNQLQEKIDYYTAKKRSKYLKHPAILMEQNKIAESGGKRLSKAFSRTGKLLPYLPKFLEELRQKALKSQKIQTQVMANSPAHGQSVPPPEDTQQESKSPMSTTSELEKMSPIVTPPELDQFSSDFPPAPHNSSTIDEDPFDLTPLVTDSGSILEDFEDEQTSFEFMNLEEN